MRRALAAVGVATAAAIGCAPALGFAGTPPPTTTGNQGIALVKPVRDVDPLKNAGLGLRRDRLLTSVVPGPVVNTEQLTVAVGPSGAPEVVTDLQQLVIT